ncbi:MAG: hypothetical protein KBT87_02150 [Gammaproteobacteria bacterium]|nr:hypothetical protein [Gammaproteobacteria bacterium]MBQ0773453.1 hypothetical protein [Gammaproteobacteria bacterium]
MTRHKKAAGKERPIRKAITQSDNNTDKKVMSVTLTKVTSQKPDRLTKRLWLDGNQLQKKAAANMVAGVAECCTVSGAAEFAALLENMQPNQALCYGAPKAADIGAPYKAEVLSRTEYDRQGQPAGAITRTKDAFLWAAGAGVLMLDYDPPPDKPAMTRQQLLDALGEAIPAVANCASVCWYSSSSLIFNEQEQVAGVKGQRVYIMVTDARDIERAGAVLFGRLWLAGHGHYEISRAGSALERSIIDASVWQANRLDFAAGADCVAPLEQRRGKPAVQEGALLDTASELPDLTEAELAEVTAAKEKAKAAIQDDITGTRTVYIHDTAAGLVAKKHGSQLTGDDYDKALDEARQTISRAVQQNVLAGDFAITLADGQSVTVGELLGDTAKYHGKQTRDPLEPEYSGHKICGKLYLMGGRPNLYSQAHGGRNFRLIRQPRRIEHVSGLMADTTRQTIRYLKQMPDVFDLGTELVQVQDGKAQRLTQHSLSFWLGGVAQYWQWVKPSRGQEYEKPIDPPAQVLNQLLAIRRHLKPLKAVISAPVMDEQGQALGRVGYDSKTQLYLDMQDNPPPVPAAVNTAEAMKALDTLMQPFNKFCVATPLDRGVLLAAILTAIQRPVLGTAPAIGLDAPVQGTGKTYLALCLGVLATGLVAKVYPHTGGRDDEETRKRLTAMLADGEQVIVWDNVLGHFDSAALAAFITSQTYSDRVLGKSETVTFPNRALLLITGNNLTLAGDMPRRVLKCRLDAQVDNPALRKFDSDPLQYIQQHRQEIVQAGLTLIRGYQQSAACRDGGAVPNETTASFEQWDSLVRQPVAWIAQQCSDYQDPADAIKNAVATDPEKELLAEVLDGIAHVIGVGEWFDTRQLYRELTTCSNLGGADKQATKRELVEVLTELLGKELNSKGLGRALGYRVDRIVDGWRLVKRTHNKRTRFKLDVVYPEQIKSAVYAVYAV